MTGSARGIGRAYAEGYASEGAKVVVADIAADGAAEVAANIVEGGGEAIGLGVDMFDCVLPTRHGRHGTVLTDAGRMNLRNARFATDDGPLDPACPCPVCARWSRGYLRHLLQRRRLRRRRRLHGRQVRRR